MASNQPVYYPMASPTRTTVSSPEIVPCPVSPSVFENMALINTTHQKAMANLTRFSSKLITVDAELAASKEELYTVQHELHSVRQQLATAQEGLAFVQHHLTAAKAQLAALAQASQTELAGFASTAD